MNNTPRFLFRVTKTVNKDPDDNSDSGNYTATAAAAVTDDDYEDHDAKSGD